MAAKQPARTRAGTTALPRKKRAVARSWSRFLPSRGSIVAGLAIAAAAGCAYAGARETSVFAVRQIEVRGAPPAVAAEVRAALGDVRGRSLVGLDGAALERRVEALPTIFAVSYDRAFPHTLRLVVRAERPVAVLRQADSSWLVSARGRIVQPLHAGALAALPRIWIPRSVPIVRGGTLSLDGGAGAARVLGLLARDGFPGRVVSATVQHSEVFVQLRSGFVVRLGRPVDLDLKLAIARRLVPRLGAQERYLDVSVPGRPVAGANVQVSG
jgi:cell division protein FtsQ